MELLISLIILLGLVGVVIGLRLARSITELVQKTPPPLTLPKPAITQLVKLLDLQSTDVVVDLGCGDGQLLAACCQIQPRARYQGIDHDPTVLIRAWWRLRPWRGQVKLIQQSILSSDLSSATKVVCYLSRELMEKLEPTLDAKLRSGSCLISADYPLPRRQPSRVISVDTRSSRGRVLYQYRF